MAANGTAQVARTTNGMSVTGGVAGFKARVLALIASMAPGMNVQAYKLNELSALINLWDTHTHSVSDMRGKDTFGNVITYGAAGTSITATSLPVKGAAPPSILVAAGQPISHNDHNFLQAAIEYIRPGHTHTITDTLV